MIAEDWVVEKQLNNKIIIVTGAAGGLGEAMVKALVEAGAKIALERTRSQQGDHSRRVYLYDLI